MLDDKLAAYCRALPKVELHAHIHGSIRPSTLEEVLQDEAELNGTEPLRLPKNRSLDECFEMFGLIHQVVVSRRVLRRVVIEAVEDFAAENVKYLELRSTPRDLARDGATRADYVDEVVSALQECHARRDLDVEVRLLLSINRNQPLHLAEDTVAMALERKHERKCPFIVGIDLSGNSERPDCEFYRFEQVLERARAGGLKLAVHFAEHFDDQESARILNFGPDRLGHACCLPEPLYAKMLALRIPVEVCLTSNVHTLARYRRGGDCKCPSDAKLEVSGLCECGFTSHPHGKLLANERGQEQQLGVYPLCLCTDDYGVLDTTLSTEYLRAARAFALSKARLLEIAKAPIDTIFDHSQVARLKVLFEKQGTASERPMASRALLPVIVAVFSVCVAAIDASNATESAAALVFDIPECTRDQLQLGEAILTTEPNTLRCEDKIGIKSGMLLQSADAADELCGEQICLTALRTLLFTLPNCRYELWGLKFSAAKFLQHCGIATNATGIAVR
ncbi:hypothetical protein PHYPSEUDO_002471 [Phytophthora pseudosyringae]|uniref:Adenosine deaminase domain-containing protein n=1 Tax=Phytophthora pseudosyringae TaxID=221518 RepID=A0A8T1VTQ7_9STRA|nr:hypothetical protein PHYPSEUDO_002471 [Phytophthora pseudosyringae]